MFTAKTPMRSDNDAWIEYFRADGYRGVEPLAVGMEGAIYRLEDGLVAKVWRSKAKAELLVLQRFYEDLLGKDLPFSTPVIVDVKEVGRTSISVERELVGRPLQEFLEPGDTRTPMPVKECLLIVLRGLASVGDCLSALTLPVLSEGVAFRREDSWSGALEKLLGRRVDRFGGQLRAAIPDFDILFESVQRALATGVHRDGVVHGDIFGGNILVNDEVKPTALLDWGFLSSWGDPAFDASVAAGIFNMYGPHAREMDLELLEYFSVNLDVPLDRLLIYRAAYAIATSNAYDPHGQDGHFAWCVAALQSREVKAALEPF